MPPKKITKKWLMMKNNRADISLLNIQKVPVSKISLHPNNTRIHNSRNIDAIKKSLENFGQRTPIVVGKNWQILKGNGTYEAILALGWKKVNISRCTHLTEMQELEYAIADNKTGDLSENDFEKMTEILKMLRKNGSDLSSTGFSDFEIQPLLNANWNVEAPSSMPKILEKHTITLTEEQWEIFLKEKNRLNKDMSSADFLMNVLSKIRRLKVKKVLLK